MSGLLDFFTNKENPEPLLLLMGLAGAAGSRNSGEAVRNGLTGLLQGIVAIDNKKDEDAKYLAAQSRQSRQDELEARVKEAQIQHYLYQQKNGADPYWTTLDTPQGLVKFNARTGEALPIDINGQPIIKSSSDVGLQGRISGAKANASEGEKVHAVVGSDNATRYYQGKDLPGFKPLLQPDFQSQQQLIPQQSPQQSTIPQDQSRAWAQSVLPNLIRTESGGNPNAVSPKGAVGLTQIMPATGKNPGYGIAPLKNHSPEEEKRFAVDYLTTALNHFGGDAAKAVSSYNQGIGGVEKNGIINPQYVASVLGDKWRNNPQAALKEIRGGNAFSAPIVQAGRDAVASGMMTKPQAKQMMQAAADGVAKDVVDPFRSPTKAETLALETQAKATQAQNEAQIKLDYVAPTEKAKIIAENQANAQVALPQAQSDAQSILDTINELRSHKGLDKGVGASSIFFNRVPGTDAYDFANLHENARGKVFMQAFNSLKGAGAITDLEGKAATNAISEMGDLKQSKESYLNSLSKLESVVKSSLERKQNSAGKAPQQQIVNRPTVSNW